MLSNTRAIYFTFVSESARRIDDLLIYSISAEDQTGLAAAHGLGWLRLCWAPVVYVAHPLTTERGRMINL
jgi:hypothetical protein